MTDFIQPCRKEWDRSRTYDQTTVCDDFDCGRFHGDSGRRGLGAGWPAEDHRCVGARFPATLPERRGVCCAAGRQRRGSGDCGHRRHLPRPPRVVPGGRAIPGSLPHDRYADGASRPTKGLRASRRRWSAASRAFASRRNWWSGSRRCWNIVGKAQGTPYLEGSEGYRVAARQLLDFLDRYPNCIVCGTHFAGPTDPAIFSTQELVGRLFRHPRFLVIFSRQGFTWIRNR